MGNSKPQYRNTLGRSRPVTVRAMLSLVLQPSLKKIRLWIVNAQIQHTSYQIGHIQSARRNDFLVEKELHKLQVRLVSERNRLEVQ